jgi:hypothetical protein
VLLVENHVALAKFDRQGQRRKCGSSQIWWLAYFGGIDRLWDSCESFARGISQNRVDALPAKTPHVLLEFLKRPIVVRWICKQAA